jgi:hypothetical protein
VIDSTINCQSASVEVEITPALSSRHTMPVTKSDAPTAKKLAHLYRLIFTFPDLLEPDSFVPEEGNGPVFLEPAPLAKAVAAKGVMPLWLEECPAEYRLNWGEDWKSFHDSLRDMAKLTKKGSIDTWNWVNNGLSDVLTLAREEGWDSCCDEMVRVQRAGRLRRCSPSQSPLDYQLPER